MFGLNWFFSNNSKLDSSKVLVRVIEKSSFSDLADTLAVHKIIDRKYSFIVCGVLLGADRKIKSGIYEIPYGLSNYELIKIFVEGKAKAIKKITFPEGLTLKQIAKITSNNFNFTQEEFLKAAEDSSLLNRYGIEISSLEGFLMPDTYEFFEDSKPNDIILKMADTFERFYKANIIPYEKKLGLTKNQIITLASIIEAETSLDSERATISGVYHNRLKKGMRLEADPTVAYALPDGPRIITYKDLKFKSLYNTYIYENLPPGPINNPGRASLLAAVNPEKHNYLYFVASPKDDGHIFSQNYYQHQRAVRYYRLNRK